MEVHPIFLIGVEGHMGRLNDVLFKPALPKRRNIDQFRFQKTLVFFGGDVQNLMHLMDQDNPEIKYQKWCLEATAERLGVDFPSHNIVVIKPSRIMFEHVSCFDNFVEGDFLGAPRHLYHYSGLPHLEKLLKRISHKVKQMPSEELFKMMLSSHDEDDLIDDKTKDENTYENMSKEMQMMLYKWQKKLRLHRYPLTLVAFSKGCVVLNQFIYEIHYARRLEPHNQDSSFISRIEMMFWLDGGHPGHENVYITSLSPLKTLSELSITMFLHLSVYQVEDVRRPWIREQCQSFARTLLDLKANLNILRHVTPTGDLRGHFLVLQNFRRLLCISECQRADAKKRCESADPPAEYDDVNTVARTQCRPRGYFTPREIIGISLISPNDTPYLGLQLIRRHMSHNNANPNRNPEADAPDQAASPRIAPNFAVLMTTQSHTINFKKDLEAVDALMNATFYDIEEPVVALPNNDSDLGFNVYRPVNEFYVPYLESEGEKFCLNLLPFTQPVHPPEDADTNSVDSDADMVDVDNSQADSDRSSVDVEENTSESDSDSAEFDPISIEGEPATDNLNAMIEQGYLAQGGTSAGSGSSTPQGSPEHGPTSRASGSEDYIACSSIEGHYNLTSFE